MRSIIALSFTFVLLVPALAGCSHQSPNLRGEVWAGSSGSGGIERRQDKQKLSCSDPAFDEYTAMKYTSLTALIQSCKEWY